MTRGIDDIDGEFLGLLVHFTAHEDVARLIPVTNGSALIRLTGDFEPAVRLDYDLDFCHVSCTREIAMWLAETLRARINEQPYQRLRNAKYDAAIAGILRGLKAATSAAMPRIRTTAGWRTAVSA
ncbi:MAG TPA: hypothetical protein VH277_01350 [Gemmatimonadaceae bacterium]|jgi:hypothetical protein|nr:hypothetical protein [Gemmatimonadaceae bacterium]